MMLNRRNLLKSAIAATFASGASFGFANHAYASNKKVVIVGGGIGGATAAKYIQKYDSAADITIIEKNPDYYTCFMSNEVIGGNRSMESIHFTYEKLKARGIKVVFDTVSDIDAKGQSVKTASGKAFAYDRCIVSPGVQLKYEAIPGYSKEASKSIPHAWKAGPQTELLRKQLVDMKDGGTVVMIAPPNPFRCPPGPYERVSQIAAYLQEHKPNSKIVILDPKDKFSKQGLFMDGWKRYYGYGTEQSMISWIPAKDGGKVTKIDAASKTVTYGDGKTLKADVLNIIPPQQAGSIAIKAGLADDKGWCPVDQKTFESTLHKNIYVIGDASIAGPLPKSGYAANSEAKICAVAVVTSLNNQPMIEPSWVNTCYSVIKPGDGITSGDGISVAMVYAYKDGKIVKVDGSGGLTGAFDAELRKREVLYAHSWFKNITVDTFG
ncbi:MAG: FAD-dependent oxidoreductase [Thiotrichales bacterium]|nr:FAD-dependent oxidoreductase [Thiotrichales bacterium]